MEQTLTLRASRPWGRWLLIGTGVVLTLLLLVVPMTLIWMALMRRLKKIRLAWALHSKAFCCRARAKVMTLSC